MERETIKPEFLCNLSNYCTAWMCVCGTKFKTNHDIGVLNNTDIMYCSKCGVKFDWGLVEEDTGELMSTITKLREDGKITEVKYQELIEQLKTHDADVRNEALDALYDRCRTYKTYQKYMISEIGGSQYRGITFESLYKVKEELKVSGWNRY